MREILYYLFGFLPSLFFFSRFFVQWIASERQKRSLVPPIFWKLSLCGNGLLSLHYFLQAQFPLLFIQCVNGFIAWRNLHLQIPRKRALQKLCFLLLSLLLLVALQMYVFHISWLNTPLGLKREPVALLWHFWGLTGSLLFASRFWLQWWQAERTSQSHLSQGFWVLSIAGSIVALTYFIHILDWVSICNYSLGLIPYIRNLYLVRTVKKA